ncbi:hypothetical protein NGK12_08150 [Raoultella ornithinolytica]|uniref:hypothetical protein n=1 Tax=Raoultella ornithinolytica TaxID=54291 RepID=UPI001A2A2544|nr:hypothetical protein [Raoultella ornithinolytica]MCZ0876040.1 hypothetical protein [Raoultella ornithinolytica]MEB7860534.1 hypothetical protein [Raoultella ornithinolytica]MEB7982289.1 hypothetical protein [Raoultella ornithinolytica]HAT3642601.1 hypothetical protein [Raoultella ornithinolytica]
MALRLPGLQGVGRVARLSVAPAGAIPRWRCAYRGYRDVRSDCPAKRRASRSNPPVALRLPGLQGRAVGLPG